MPSSTHYVARQRPASSRRGIFTGVSWSYAPRPRFPPDEITTAIYARNNQLAHAPSVPSTGSSSLNCSKLLVIVILLQCYVVYLYFTQENAMNDHYLPSFGLYAFKSQANISGGIVDTFRQKLHLRGVSIENISMPSIHFNINSTLEYGQGLGTHSYNQGLNLLAMGTVLGGEQVDIKPFTIFVKSLRKVNNKVEIVIIVEAPLLKDMVELAQQEAITLVESHRDVLQPSFIRKYHASTLQWLLYCDYIELRRGQLDGRRTDYVAIFDVSSTVFQLDPFGHLLKRKPSMKDLYVFTESGGERINEVSGIVATIDSCFGVSTRKDIQDRSMLTPRVVAGSFGAVRSYLGKMQAILLNKEGDGLSSSELPLKVTDSTYLLSDVPTCEKEGLGTVAHNLLVYADLLKTPFPLDINVNIKGEDEEPFLTYILPATFSNVRRNAMNSASEAFDEKSKQVVSTVLDYSHNFILSQDIMGTYLPSVYLNLNISEYEHTSMCRRYTFIPGRDVFHGICDLVTFKALTSASCCHICNTYVMKSRDKIAKRNCNGFTFLHGENSCRLKSCLDKDIKDVIHSDMQEGPERMVRYRMITSGSISAYLTPANEMADTSGEHTDDGVSRGRGE